MLINLMLPQIPSLAHPHSTTIPLETRQIKYSEKLKLNEIL